MKILLIVVAIIAVAVFVFFMGGQPPLRGAGQLATSDQMVIISRARPALTFAPAAAKSGEPDFAPQDPAFRGW